MMLRGSAPHVGLRATHWNSSNIYIVRLNEDI